MLPRATRILRIVEQGLSRRDRALEQDPDISELQIRIKINPKTGSPQKAVFIPTSEYDICGDPEK